MWLDPDWEVCPDDPVICSASIFLFACLVTMYHHRQLQQTIRRHHRTSSTLPHPLPFFSLPLLFFCQAPLQSSLPPCIPLPTPPPNYHHNLPRSPCSPPISSLGQCSAWRLFHGPFAFVSPHPPVTESHSHPPTSQLLSIAAAVAVTVTNVGPLAIE
ncbi:hypothetical protein IWX49DRAFT_77284 [Phyllosticta citricarpa]